jgi:hypothetical protein
MKKDHATRGTAGGARVAAVLTDKRDETRRPWHEDCFDCLQWK